MEVISGLCGGLALFLYGMGLMSQSLSSLCGSRFGDIVRAATKSRVRGFFTGFGVTALVQSSSAVAVLLIGLVGSGVTDFAASFGVIVGANVGTTVTAWLIALSDAPAFLSFLKPSVFAPILALVGVFAAASKNTRIKNIGSIAAGFGILIIGMELMSESASFVKNSPQFKYLLTAFKNPLVGILVSAAFTAIIQSSSATVGILQALTFGGGITLPTVIPLVIGANIGTCITGLIASVGAPRSAVRVAAMQVYFNLFGALALMPLFLLLNIPHVVVNSVGVATVHTAFNLVTAALALPLSRYLIFITEKTVK